MRRLGGEQEDRHIERTEQMIARLIKEYGTPTSVIGLLVYQVGKTQNWW